MAVYAPGDTPPVDPNADPGMWARLMGFVGGLNPIGSAQAGEAPPQGPGPPMDPDAAARQAAIERLKPQMASPGNTNAPGIMPHIAGDGPNVQGRPVLPYIDPRTGQIANAASIPTDLPPAAAAAPPAAAQPMMPPRTPTPASAYGFPLPPPRPVAPVATAPVRHPARKPVRIPASATASVPPGMAKGWTEGEYQNRDISGGALARGGTARMGMLDLSKLFGQR